MKRWIGAALLVFAPGIARANVGICVDVDVKSWAVEPPIVEPAKCAALDWFALDGLPDPVVPHERFVLERLGTSVESYTTFGF